MQNLYFTLRLTLFISLVTTVFPCSPCYYPYLDDYKICSLDKPTLHLHMTIQPRMDTYRIFNFSTLYNPPPTLQKILNKHGYTPVKQILNTAFTILKTSHSSTSSSSPSSKQSQRSFLTTYINYFRKWYSYSTYAIRTAVKYLIINGYWELTGGFVEEDHTVTYYYDILENLERGMKWMKDYLGYRPRVAVYSGASGHSQSIPAILSQSGFEGLIVEKVDDSLVRYLGRKFIWRAMSTNGNNYGILPTVIHFSSYIEDKMFEFDSKSYPICSTKKEEFDNMRIKHSHLRNHNKLSQYYFQAFGSSFQYFPYFNYKIIEALMQQYSRYKCTKIIALYDTPTNYFLNALKYISYNIMQPRIEDILPVWSENTGMYETGYYATDAYHKSKFKQFALQLQAYRKIYLLEYVSNPTSLWNQNTYKLLYTMAEQVATLQHHNVITSTSTYNILDELYLVNNDILNQQTIVKTMFKHNFPRNTDNPILYCNYLILDHGEICTIPAGIIDNIYVKLISTGSMRNRRVVIQLPFEYYYVPTKYYYDINCLCVESNCPCKLYIYIPNLPTNLAFFLYRIRPSIVNHLVRFRSSKQYRYNYTHFTLIHNDQYHHLSYKSVVIAPSSRNLNQFTPTGYSIIVQTVTTSSKSIMGNLPQTLKNYSTIRKVYFLRSRHITLFLITWQRYAMKTLITIPNNKPNYWSIYTLSAALLSQAQDIYLYLATPLQTDTFTTDCNGWLTTTRRPFYHADYKEFVDSYASFDDFNSNTYPITSFIYLNDSNTKISINVDRPQGVAILHKGTFYMHIDRLTETRYKSYEEYAKRNYYLHWKHVITVDNMDNNERMLQRINDELVFIQANTLLSNERVEEMQDISELDRLFEDISGIKDIKMNIRFYNDTTVLLRLHNLNDYKVVKTVLYRYVDKISPLLSVYYYKIVTFQSIEYMTLTGTKKYSDFLNYKWNSNYLTKYDSLVYSRILAKYITLKPLEIRVFQLYGITFKNLYSSTINVTPGFLLLDAHYEFDLYKIPPLPKFTERIVYAYKYLNNGNHCELEGTYSYSLFNNQKVDTPIVPNKIFYYESFKPDPHNPPYYPIKVSPAANLPNLNYMQYEPEIFAQNNKNLPEKDKKTMPMKNSANFPYKRNPYMLELSRLPSTKTDYQYQRRTYTPEYKYILPSANSYQPYSTDYSYKKPAEKPANTYYQHPYEATKKQLKLPPSKPYQQLPNDIYEYYSYPTPNPLNQKYTSAKDYYKQQESPYAFDDNRRNDMGGPIPIQSNERRKKLYENDRPTMPRSNSQYYNNPEFDNEYHPTISPSITQYQRRPGTKRIPTHSPTTVYNYYAGDLYDEYSPASSSSSYIKKRPKVSYYQYEYTVSPKTVSNQHRVPISEYEPNIDLYTIPYQRNKKPYSYKYPKTTDYYNAYYRSQDNYNYNEYEPQNYEYEYEEDAPATPFSPVLDKSFKDNKKYTYSPQFIRNPSLIQPAIPTKISSYDASEDVSEVLIDKKPQKFKPSLNKKFEDQEKGKQNMEDNKIKKTNSASKIIFNALKAKINKFEALTIVDKKRYFSMKLYSLQNPDSQ